MRKNFISLLTMAAFVVGFSSCNGNSKKAEEAATTEEAAVIAGSVSKSLLTEELKTETTQFLKDMPDSDLAYKLATGEVKASIAKTNFMLPVSKAAELNTQSQKARACGIYFADLNTLKAMGKPTSEVENTLVKLTTDLNIPFVIDIMKESAPAGASKEELNKFLNAQEDKLIDAMMENDKADIELEMLGGMSVEYAYMLGNPGLVIEGDAVSAGLSDNMAKRLETLTQIVNDLSQYYPDLAQLSTTIAPLNDQIVSISAARAAQKDIATMRDNLLK
ncbi:MAG: hypothetical protein RR249_04065 [Tannerellaceae bacterium]